MSKVGRRPIDTNQVQVEVKGREIHYKGRNASGVHELPVFLKAELDDNKLMLSQVNPSARHHKKFWGLHRALVANKLYGAAQDFEKKMKIVGLGFKAEVSGAQIKLSLGFSHKIDMALPKGVSMETDKTGQLLTLRSFDKELLGLTCDKIRSLRPPEPYKGTGVRLADEVVRRKAGKKKSS